MFFRFNVWVILLVLALAGCSKKKELKAIQVFPVSGKILVSGKAPEKAILTLNSLTPIRDPANRVIVPMAVVGVDGSFKVRTYTNDDGAPAGEYSITVVWPTYSIEAGEEVTGPDRWNGVYNNKDKPVAKFTVKEGDNKIPEIKL